ncbi:MAG: cache domain-containing protein [Campylobacterota bacterium]|nr:cache domain-containing protein [Campylobacterota bacterium]
MEQMQIDTKNLKKNIFFTIAIVSICLASVVSFFTYVTQEAKFNNLSKTQEIKLNKSINNIMDSYVRRYSSSLERLRISKNIVSLFKNSNRKELYKVVKPQWDIMKNENPHITVMHFHKSDGTSLLRMHQYDKYGDDISLVRPMLKVIHKNHKIITGYETGLYAIVFRIIYPIFDNNKYIGALEIGINPDGFIDNVKRFSNVNGVLFVKKDNLKLYKKDIDFKISEYTLQSNATEEQDKILSVLPKDYNFSSHHKLKVDNKEYILHSVPVINFEEEIVANLLFFYDITVLTKTKSSLIYIILINLFFFVSIILYLTKMQLDKIEVKITESYLKLITKVIKSKQTYIDFFNNTNSADIVCKFDKSNEIFKIKAINPMVKEIENIKEQDISNKNIVDVLPGIKKCGLYDVMNKVYSTEKSIKMPIVFYEDKYRNGYREYYIFKLGEDSIVISYTDYTKQKALEDELKNKEQLMIAQSRHAAMGEMISMIAHQWRQPIAVISMGANNILVDIELDMVTNEELEDIANDILGQTDYLTQTIDDFRDFFRPKKEKELFFVKNIFTESLKVIGKSLENNNIELKKSCLYDKQINSYSRELLQVLINIIKNAKEVLVENNIKNKSISISCYESNHMVVANICDNAGGVPDDIKDKIFEPYFSTKDEKTGTGLGLYMSKTIVEKHLNGILSVENKDGGACFKIELPQTKS